MQSKSKALHAEGLSHAVRLDLDAGMRSSDQWHALCPVKYLGSLTAIRAAPAWRRPHLPYAAGWNLVCKKPCATLYPALSIAAARWWLPYQTKVGT